MMSGGFPIERSTITYAISFTAKATRKIISREKLPKRPATAAPTASTKFCGDGTNNGHVGGANGSKRYFNPYNTGRSINVRKNAITGPYIIPINIVAMVVNSTPNL